MSAEINDGGPAFPVPPPIAETDGVSMQWSRAEPGMSYRQWLAGKAIQGLCANSRFAETPEDVLATYAVRQADAVIAALKGGAE